MLLRNVAVHSADPQFMALQYKRQNRTLKIKYLFTRVLHLSFKFQTCNDVHAITLKQIILVQDDT